MGVIERFSFNMEEVCQKPEKAGDENRAGKGSGDGGHAGFRQVFMEVTKGTDVKRFNSDMTRNDLAKVPKKPRAEVASHIYSVLYDSLLEKQRSQ